MISKTIPDAKPRMPSIPHLGIWAGDNSVIEVPPGATMFTIVPHPGRPKEMPDVTPMLLTKVEAKPARVKLTFRCCANPRCNRTLTMEGSWNGRHFPLEDLMTPESV